MKLAVFDLDDTLLPIDTGNLWTRWLAKRSGPDAERIERASEAYARAYREGALDADALARFQTEVLALHPRKELERWRDDFLNDVVRPALRSEASDLVRKRREAGFEVVLATGTNRFVTEPIAALFGIKRVFALTPEVRADGEFTGNYVGPHSYGEGKLRWLKAFLSETDEALDALIAYSDSINDLPLLSFAASHPKGEAVAVRPDPKLREEALRRGWPVLNLFP